MLETSDSAALATDVTVAWLSNPHTRASADEASALLLAVHKALTDVATLAPAAAPSPEQPEADRAVTIRKSLATRDHIVSMIDGKSYRGLRRHLTANGLTPDEYRQRYGLPADYPMVAPGYSEARSALSKKLGLGRKPATATMPPSDDGDAAAPVARKQLGIFAAKAAAKEHLGG